MPSDWIQRERTARIPLTVNISRPPGRSQGWTAESGYWRADGMATEKAALDALTSGVAVFLSSYRPPQVLSYRGRVAVVSIGQHTEYGQGYHVQIVQPDGRVTLSYRGARTWDEVLNDSRVALAHFGTDWHDDASVRNAAAYLAAQNQPTDDAHADDRTSPSTFMRYASWQRAARAAIDAGRTDWHEWATQNVQDFRVPDAEVTAYRFTHHSRPNGSGCPWSMCSVVAPEQRTTPGNRRCPDECPTSDVEINPYADDQRYDPSEPDPADEPYGATGRQHPEHARP